MKRLIVCLVIALETLLLEGKSVNNCNDACQTATYGVSKDGMIGCSGSNCLMEASFQSNLVAGQIVFNINLIGYGVSSLKDPAFSVIIKGATAETQYYAWPGDHGTGEGRVFVAGDTYSNGSTKVQDDNLYCSWYMTENDVIWPSSKTSAFDLINSGEFELVFVVGNKRFSIASDILQLPIYKLQSLKCCHQVHGDDKYQLIVKQTDLQTDFFLQTFGPKPKILSTEFSDPNGKTIIFDCYIQEGYMRGYLKTGDIEDITNQLTLISIIKPDQCSWSAPFQLITAQQTYNTKNGVYDLQILANSEVVYTEPNVQLKGVSVTVMSSFILILSSIVIHFSIYY